MDKQIEQDEKLKDFLIFLSKDELTESKYTDAKDFIKKIYINDYRHKYSLISTFIYKNNDLRLNTISENLRNIIKQNGLDNKQIKSLEKLYDHINLELVRLNYTNSIASKIENLKETSEKIQKDSHEVKTIIDKQQTNYITILGIFASIILAFVSGLTFTNSILANIDKVGIYRFLLIMCFIALFIVNILYYLFSFLKSIIKQEKEKCCNFAFIFFNIFIVASIIILFFLLHLRVLNLSLFSKFIN